MSMLIKPANINSHHTRAFFTTGLLLDGGMNITDKLADECDISKNKMYLPVQKHTDIVHVLGCVQEPAVSDAVVTDRKEILIGVLVADCVPVLLYDDARGVISAVHAGWRGTAKQILIKTVRVMTDCFSCKPENIRAAIGPSIRKCSYEVGKDVKDAVRGATGDGDYYQEIDGRHFIDLSTANKIQAVAAGIRQDNIWQSEECTFCNPDKYYSYRYSGAVAGRQGGFIGMW